MNVNVMATRPSIGWQAGEWASLLFERRQRGALEGAVVNLYSQLLDHDDALDSDDSGQAVSDLARGGYSLLYGAAPRDTETGPAWARALASAIEALPGLGEACAAVAGDPDMAAIATAAMLNAAAGKVGEVVDGLREAGLDPVSGQPLAGGSLDAEEQSAFITEIGRSVGIGAGVAGRVLDDVADARESLNGVLPGLGAPPARSEQESPGRLALIERLRTDARLRRVLQIAGRMQRIAERVRVQRTDDVPEEVVDVERGGDLGRILPSELVGLRHPALRRLALKGLAERSMLQYKLTGTERLGRGPIAVLLDVSDSMARPLCGLRRIDWAAAVGVAAIRSAVLQRRPVSLAAFNGGIARSWVVPAGDTKAAAAAVVEVACIQAGGGTRFDSAISWALDAGAERDRADLVLVTDGEDDVSKSVATRLADAKSRGLRLWGVLAGDGGLDESMRSFADDVAVLRDGVDVAQAVGNMGGV